jgi:hypothetical protein
MATPATTDHREQACVCQLREMSAGRLRRDPRRAGKLARGQGTAIDKRRHHRRSRRVSDERRNLGDDSACNHFCYLTPESVDEHLTMLKPHADFVVLNGRTALSASASQVMMVSSGYQAHEKLKVYVGCWGGWTRDGSRYKR